ncbi:MAG: glycine cleavage system protein R [Deltaproteobacteria bacterium]|nr:glycine cleavage system protein R [Deltaproteobacteria bacterium]MBN2674653.1 glycine cleavage system protein R [Deltaproteobacteria bacterium]
MTTKMVMYAIGPDRPGLVSRLSAVVHNAGGNFEDSRMATLAGDFALLVLFSADDTAITQIQNDVKKIESELEITTHFRKASQKSDAGGTHEYSFEATGHDRPGIVSRLSAVLSQNDVNVISMDTSLVNMAFIGTPMFKIKGKVQTPKGTDIASLRDTLEDVCEDMELVLEFSL